MEYNSEETFNSLAPDVKAKLQEALEVIEDLAQIKPQIFNFHPRFYIPGWVGEIQYLIVNNKINKEGKKPFYKGQSYYEVADWILNEAKALSDLQAKEKPEDGTSELTNFKEQSDFIIRTVMTLIETWAQCYPEISSFANRKLDDNTMISLAGLLYYATKEFLKPIGNTDIGEGKKEFSFWEDTKDNLHQLLGAFVNLALLGAICGLCSLFF